MTIIGLAIIVGFAVWAWALSQDSKRAREERLVTQEIARDAETASITTLRILMALEAALADAPANQKAVIDLLLSEIRKLQEQQTQVIIREQRSNPETIVVYITPEPQPTATVTCNPTPVVGNCRGPRR